MSKLPSLRRIGIVMTFYNKRGVNKESVNKVYRKIINTPKSERDCRWYVFYTRNGRYTRY